MLGIRGLHLRLLCQVRVLELKKHALQRRKEPHTYLTMLVLAQGLTQQCVLKVEVDDSVGIHRCDGTGRAKGRRYVEDVLGIKPSTCELQHTPPHRTVSKHKVAHACIQAEKSSGGVEVAGGAEVIETSNSLAAGLGVG